MATYGRPLAAPSIVGAGVVFPEQAALALRRGREDARIEAPVEVRREVLRHLAAAVVNLEKIAHVGGGAIVAARVPHVAAKDERVAGLREHRFRRSAVPGILVVARRTARAV